VKAARFEYHAPAVLAEVRDLLGRYAPDAAPLAGGQSLVPLMAMREARPGVVIDLNGVAGLAGIRAEPGFVAIGAMTRQRAVERSPVVAQRLPLLVEAIGHIGHPQVRNRGTVGGSIVVGHACAELPAVALALDADLVVASPEKQRTLSAIGFYRAAPSLAPDEVLTAIRFRSPPPGTGHGFRETGRRARDFPMAGAAVVLGRDRTGLCTYARISLLGAGTGPLRATAAENALRGTPLTAEAIAAAAGAAGALASDEDCRDLTVALTSRALADAAGRARPSAGNPA
jgi:carbon-monoxide dehydrogenase medium subunit